MRTGPSTRRWDLALAAALVVVLAAWNNVVITRLPGYPASYVPINLAAAALLLAAARARGLSWDDVGLDRARFGAGLRWGGACAAVVAAGLALALLPGPRAFLRDARGAGLAVDELARQVLVVIPFGTVVWEEVAFRGVLLALLLRSLRPRLAIGVSAAVFGLWHVRPALSGLASSHLVDGPVLQGLAVIGVCAVTTAAGVLLVWLRLRSGSLLAPGLVHLSANALGTVAGALAHRLG